MNDSEGQGRTLSHFHMCVHCGSTFRREEFEGRPLTSGIYTCPKCGFEGPLNVVVREDEEPEKQSENQPGSGLPG